MNQYQLERAKAKEDAPKKKLEELFDTPPKPKGVPVATKIDELQKQIEALKKEHDDLYAKEKSAAIEDILSKIKTFSISASDLGLGSTKKLTPTGKAKVDMKYRLDNQSWSGRGRKPKWVENHLSKGGLLDDLLIKHE